MLAPCAAVNTSFVVIIMLVPTETSVALSIGEKSYAAES